MITLSYKTLSNSPDVLSVFVPEPHKTLELVSDSRINGQFFLKDDGFRIIRMYKLLPAFKGVGKLLGRPVIAEHGMVVLAEITFSRNAVPFPKAYF